MASSEAAGDGLERRHARAGQAHASLRIRHDCIVHHALTPDTQHASDTANSLEFGLQAEAAGDRDSIECSGGKRYSRVGTRANAGAREADRMLAALRA